MKIKFRKLFKPATPTTFQVYVVESERFKVVAQVSSSQGRVEVFYEGAGWIVVYNEEHYGDITDGKLLMRAMKIIDA